MLTSRFLYLLAGRVALVNEDGFIRMLFSFCNSDVEYINLTCNYTYDYIYLRQP